MDLGTKPLAAEQQRKRPHEGIDMDVQNDVELLKEAGGLDAILDRFSDKSMKKFEESNRKMLSDFLEQSDQRAEARILESEAKLRAEFTAATAAFQGEVANLTKVVEEIKKGESHKPVHMDRLKNDMKSFQPGKVEIKGWVGDWDKRYNQGLTRPEATQCINTLIRQLDEKTKELIDQNKTMKGLEGRSIFFKIEVHVIGGKEACFVVKEKFDELVKLPTNYVNGVELKCKNEVSPAMRPVVVAGAKILKFLESKGVTHLTPEWGLTLRIVWAPPDRRPVLLGEFSQQKGWDKTDGFKELPGISSEDIAAAVGQ